LSRYFRNEAELGATPTVPTPITLGGVLPLGSLQELGTVYNEPVYLVLRRKLES
jgi:hypothetical protein